MRKTQTSKRAVSKRNSVTRGVALKYLNVSGNTLEIAWLGSGICLATLVKQLRKVIGNGNLAAEDGRGIRVLRVGRLFWGYYIPQSTPASELREFIRKEEAEWGARIVIQLPRNGHGLPKGSNVWLALKSRCLPIKTEKRTKKRK